MAAASGLIVGRCARRCVIASQYTGLFNAAGVPGTAQPVRVAGSRVPASLQLVGPLRGEELLLATAQRIVAAMA